MARQWLPSTSIALGALIWSIAATGMAASRGLASVVVCRLFIGLGESLFGQAVALHYSLWYKKDEISKRLALFIGAGVLAGAFGGLIAFGVSHVKGSIATWRILFLIEGLPSVLLAVAIFFLLPSRPDKSRFFTEDERTFWHTRLNGDALAERHGGIDWSGVRRALTDPKVRNICTSRETLTHSIHQAWIVSVMYSAMNLTLGRYVRIVWIRGDVLRSFPV
jgi:MFS family permease